MSEFRVDETGYYFARDGALVRVKKVGKHTVYGTLSRGFGTAKIKWDRWGRYSPTVGPCDNDIVRKETP